MGTENCSASWDDFSIKPYTTPSEPLSTRQTGDALAPSSSVRLEWYSRMRVLANARLGARASSSLDCERWRKLRHEDGGLPAACRTGKTLLHRRRGHNSVVEPEPKYYDRHHYPD